MVDARVTYLGPTDAPVGPSRSRLGGAWKRIPLAFIVIVAVPTLITAFYFLLIASPRYVSEARFVVRGAEEQPSTLGVALQGVGLSGSSSDSFVVHEYIRSRDALKDLAPRYDVAAVLGRPGVDLLSRYPQPGRTANNESLYKAFEKFVTVGYEGSTGISTLRVQAYSARDANAIAAALLDGGEHLVNRLNDRSAKSAVADAERNMLEAQDRLNSIQTRINGFRNKEGLITIESAATENAAIIGELLTTIATLQAERTQIAAQAPQSPQLPLIDARLAAFQSQLASERAKISGGANSLATKVGGYEALLAERTMVERTFSAASSALDSARIDARRQKLYLETVVSPSMPDAPSEPKRWMAILVVFVSSMLIYGIGWLVWAGLKEHRQV